MMKKTLILAAALLSIGVGSAFANDGDVFALPAPISGPTAGQVNGQHRLFPVNTREQTDVYGLFGDGSGGLRGGGSR